MDSGILRRAAELVVAAVIGAAKSVEVSFSNHDSMKARVVGKDPGTDIALLKVDARSRALTPLTLGDSDTLRVGDSVVAIGNPFGLDRSVTAGIVSALQREIQAPNSYAIDHIIQTDAAKAHLHAATTQAVVAGETWPIGGDLIVKADGQAIGSLERLRDVIGAKKPGDSLQLQIYRGTKKMTLDATLGRQ